jgi:hypothetical protein
MHYKGLVSLEAHFATRELLEEKERYTHTHTQTSYRNHAITHKEQGYK